MPGRPQLLSRRTRNLLAFFLNAAQSFFVTAGNKMVAADWHLQGMFLYGKSSIESSED